MVRRPRSKSAVINLTKPNDEPMERKRSRIIATSMERVPCSTERPMTHETSRDPAAGSDHVSRPSDLSAGLRMRDRGGPTSTMFSLWSDRSAGTTECRSARAGLLVTVTQIGIRGRPGPGRPARRHPGEQGPHPRHAERPGRGARGGVRRPDGGAVPRRVARHRRHGQARCRSSWPFAGHLASDRDKGAGWSATWSADCCSASCCPGPPRASSPMSPGLARSSRSARLRCRAARPGPRGQVAPPPAERGLPYRRALASLCGRCCGNTAVLRRRGAYQAAMFGCFSLFWTAAPLLLEGPRFQFTQVGIGAVRARRRGRRADLAVRGALGRMRGIPASSRYSRSSSALIAFANRAPRRSARFVAAPDDRRADPRTWERRRTSWSGNARIFALGPEGARAAQRTVSGLVLRWRCARFAGRRRCLCEGRLGRRMPGGPSCFR